MYRFIPLFFSIITLLSCKTKQVYSEKNIEEPKIAFYYFDIKNTANSISINLIKHPVYKGKLKGNFTNKIPDNIKKNNSWIISFKNNKPTYQLQIPDPLIEEIEYMDSSGKLSKKTIKLTSKTLVVRIPYNKSIKTITFEKVFKDKTGYIKTQTIDSINL